MQKVNASQLAENVWISPKGKFACSDREISIALGLDLDSNEVRARHPFDVTISRIPPGKANCPYHSHSAQWEFYHVLSGHGQARDAAGLHDIGPGDAFIFRPNEAHQLINHGDADLVVLIVANNPEGESCHYPDSDKWLVRGPVDKLIRSPELGYLDGEE